VDNVYQLACCRRKRDPAKDREYRQRPEVKKRAHEYEMARREKMREYNRRYKLTPEQRVQYAEAVRDWYYNRGGKEQTAQYAAEHREQRNARNRKRWQEDAYYRARYMSRQRARRMGRGEFCEVCGAPGMLTHHIDGNPLNNQSDNLQTLCDACHILAHRKTA